MNKYSCAICDIPLNSKRAANLHLNLHPGHLLVKRKLRYRILDWLAVRFLIFSRLIGAYIIYLVVLNHFNIQVSILEGLLIGIGLGLIFGEKGDL